MLTSFRAINTESKLCNVSENIIVILVCKPHLAFFKYGFSYYSSIFKQLFPLFSFKYEPSGLHPARIFQYRNGTVLHLYQQTCVIYFSPLLRWCCYTLHKIYSRHIWLVVIHWTRSSYKNYCFISDEYDQYLVFDFCKINKEC